MRCSKWSTTARGVLRGLSPTFGTPGQTSLIRTTLSSKLSQAYLTPTFTQRLCNKQFASASSSVAPTFAQPISVQPTSFSAPWAHTDLTAPQMSRAARHAVHMSLQEPIGGVQDAYLILNSLRYSTFRSRSMATPTTRAEGVIKFDRPVSPRLSSHAMLHGLLRLGLTKEATRLASTMMESGMKLRSRTLEAMIRGLAPLPSNPRSPRKPIQAFNFNPNRSLLSNAAYMTQNEGTRLALQMLSIARKTHNRRTDGMFGTLMCLCLINGEIILASLIFAFVVNECQLRQTLGVHFKAGTPDKLEGLSQPEQMTYKARYNHLFMEHLNPNHKTLCNILDSINEAMDRKGDPEELNTTLQALANLAVLLDHRQMPFAAIAPLIRTLYRCPRTDEMVWVLDKEGHPIRVQAYSYFHSILERLTEALPTKSPPLPPISLASPIEFKDYKHIQPQLDIRSYNTLLHYNLRHRLAPQHADTILHHMIKERRPPVDPDTATYNILLRSGTLLRRNDIVHTALQALNLQHGPGQGLPSPTSKMDLQRPSKPLKVLKPMQPRGTDHLLHNQALIPKLDPHTFSSYITHLTSTGQPHLVEEFVFRIYPELQPIPLSIQQSLSKKMLHETYKNSRKACVKRAIDHGPYVLTTLLNALRKAGKVGLAKSVWCLAKQAERKSWDPRFASNNKPWCLPVQAYTVMVQCHEIEGKNPSLNPQYGTVSREQGKKKARGKGLNVYRCMKRRASALKQILATKQASSAVAKDIVIPEPDARLFSALLKLFSNTTRPRRVRRGLAHHRRQFRLAKLRHLRSRKSRSNWSPKLREIAKDMHRQGFAIPPALRHIFVGRCKVGTWHVEPPSSVDRRPFVYPRRRNHSPLSIPTTKDRGLPLRLRTRGEIGFK